MFSPAGHLQMSGLQAAEPQLSEFCRGIGISTATKRPRPSWILLLARWQLCDQVCGAQGSETEMGMIY